MKTSSYSSMKHSAISRIKTGTACVACSVATAFGDTVDRLPEISVNAPPFATAALTTPATEVTLGEAQLSHAPQRTLDGVLRDVPGFRLFRRTDAIAAHPTTQGVSLGNVSPSGASRTAVLWDGVPANDPFGGWVSWTRFAPSTISAVRLAPQGGVSPWGTGSIGGVIALESRFLNDKPFAFVEGAAGNVLRHQATVAFAEDTNEASTRLFGAVHESKFSGYPVIQRSYRGPIDERANSSERAFDAGVAQILTAGRDWRLTLRAAGWEEERNNGTPLTSNASDALDFSIRLTRSAGPDEWSSETIIYTQTRQFQSHFTSPSNNRASERLTLDQYSVPASAFGAIQRTLIPIGEKHILGAGLDFSAIEGSNFEKVYPYGSSAPYERELGGRQTDSGIFLQDTWNLAREWQIHGACRVEAHQDSGGRLREKNREAHYQQRTRIDPLFTLGARWLASNRFEWSTDLFSGGRNPTLNELYRPYIVGSQRIQANPELERESVLGGELALKIKATDVLTFRLKGFSNEVRDAIAALNSVQQRTNVERVTIRGAEAGTEWTVARGVTFQASWVATQSEVQECSKERRLEGKRLAQVPSSQAILQVRGDIQNWIWSAGYRYVAAQFDDDLNALRLSSYATFDARITRKIGKKTEVFVAGENLSNAEIQTRRDANGTVSVGAPRMWSTGLRREF